MDYVEGEDLQSKMQAHGALPLEEALEWVSQVADALIYLHGQNPPVIHRDIKPANIRITPQGRAYLVDFGLVKYYSPSLRTTMGARAVTPGYSPPEQYGQGRTDARTDIYALGATLYTLLSAEEPPESVLRVSGATLAPISTGMGNARPDIWQVIQRAMALDPKDRFQTAAEFKAALSSGLHPTPAVVQPKPAAQPVIKPVTNPAKPVGRQSAPARMPVASGGQPSWAVKNWNCLIVAGIFLGMVLITVILALSLNGPDPGSSPAGLTASTAMPVASDFTANPTAVSSARTEDPQPTLDAATRKQLMDYLLPQVMHFKGTENAPVTIIMFGDFQCPYCGRFVSSTGSQIEEEYIKSGKVRLGYWHVAFLGEESQWAAEAAECAADQGAFWEYHDKLFNSQNGQNQGAFSKDNLKQFAADLKLDTSLFNECLDSGKYTQAVQDQTSIANQLGVASTPAFVINGYPIIGAQPLEAFQMTIEQELNLTNYSKVPDQFATPQPATEAPQAPAGALPDLKGRTITVAVENAYPPFNKIDEASGKGVGWDYDVVGEICMRINCVADFKQTAWDGIFPAMQAGEYDMLADGITITDERKKIVDFSMPYVNVGQVFLVRIDETATIDEIKADSKRLVGTQLGTTNEIVAKEHFPTEQIKSFEDFGAAVLALMSGDVDGVVIDNVSAASIMNENSGKLKIAGQLSSDEQLGFVFPLGSGLKDAVNAALQSMVDDGTLEQLNIKWGLTQ
jgi:polar amino acid transport system substrate-binding protein